MMIPDSVMRRIRRDISARIDRETAGMSDDEKREFIERLKLEFSLNRWKHLVEKQRQDEADKLYYASIGREKDSFRRG